MTPITTLTFQQIDLPQKFETISYKKARIMTLQREISLLSRYELSQKIASGAAVCLNPESKGHRVYAYIDNENLCPLAKVQFYDEKGDVMFTYPWNGKCEQLGENFRLITDIRSPLCGYEEASLIHNLQVTATEKGRVIIKAKEYGGCAPIMPRDFYTFTIYDREGKEERICGAVNWTGYTGTKPGDKGQCDCDDYCNSWMEAIATDGDKLIDHALEDSYVI